MAFGGSVLYTIGTALGRAHDNQVDVEVLVEGQWLAGQVLAVDGHGVVLAAAPQPEVGTGEHWVIKVDAVSAVRLSGPTPEQAHTPIERPVHPAGARPMPGAASA
jgi:hypothetical protein